MSADLQSVTSQGEITLPADVRARKAVGARSAFRHTLEGYLLAIVSVFFCALVRRWADPVLHDTQPFSLFIVPVVLVTWLSTLGPSLCATGLGAVVAVWFFVEPRGSWLIHGAGPWISMSGYCFTALLVCWFGETRRRANHRQKQHVEAIQQQARGLAAGIAEHEQNEQALRESEGQSLAIIEAIPQMAWTMLPDGTRDLVNRRWEEYTGQAASQNVSTESWLDLVHPDDRQRAAEARHQALTTGETADYDFRLRGRDGAYRWFKSRAVALRDPAGRILKWFGTYTDITEIIEAREALSRGREELERLLGERTAEVERLQIRLLAENDYLREKVRVGHGHHRVVGQSAAIRHVLAQVEQVAATDSTVLMLGETGTGKELMAVCLHGLSSRRSRPLVSVNCAAMPAPLVESELFGREKGAFTGSLSRQIGRFELADHSTIFLDEVGEIPPEVQSKLLRVLEAKQIERLGNPRPISVDVRIIAATNQDLEKAVAEGKFRQDLFYRLNVFPIAVPPLRERREDIPLLVWAFVDEFAKTFNKNIQSIERESMDALQRYAWPGNVRELRNLVERAMIVARGSRLRIQLPAAPALFASPGGRKLEEVEREHILSVLEKVGWRIRGEHGAAIKLGLKPTTLEAKMAKLGICRPTVTANDAAG